MTSVSNGNSVFAHLYNSKLFKSKTIYRTKFDPTNSDHRKAFAHFIKNGSWIMHFYVELPYLSVPHTIQAKLAEYALAQELTNIGYKSK